MQIFKSKDGRLITPVPHVAIFKGKRNSSKGKALILLRNYETRFFTAKQIHERTGINLDYLQGRLSYWYNWRYINRKTVTPAKGRPYYSYQIAARGINFVDVRIPAGSRARYIYEINEWTKSGGAFVKRDNTITKAE